MSREVKEHLDRVRDEFIKLGYELDSEGHNLDELVSEGEKYFYCSLTNTEVDHLRVELFVKTKFEDYYAAKFNLTDYESYVNFTNEELKILDENRFRLHDDYTDQNIDDWFWNAEELESD